MMSYDCAHVRMYDACTYNNVVYICISSLASQTLLAKKIERGSGESCTSGLYRLRNFMAPIRLQNAIRTTAEMQRAARGWPTIHSTALAPYIRMRNATARI